MRPTTRVLGAAIVLPDHPQIAPESRGGLFDSTEIEEALLLHVKTLSDGEREEIERDDPTVARWWRAPRPRRPDDMLALHGRVTLRDPADRAVAPGEPRPGLAGAPGLVDPQAEARRCRRRRRALPSRRQGAAPAATTPICTRACSTDAPRRSSGS